MWALRADREIGAGRPASADMNANLAGRQVNQIASAWHRAAPEAFDLSKETDATLNLYGSPRGDNRSINSAN